MAAAAAATAAPTSLEFETRKFPKRKRIIRDEYSIDF
jgi:hypothetical protein